MDKGARINKAVKCDICNITLNSEQQAQQHYSGKNHLKKLKGIGGSTATAVPHTVTAAVPPTSAPTQQTPFSQDPKLDPVSQAVYDNVLGKLPLKRKKEIPCTPCGLVFNSDAQATAHFCGSRHMKRQKVSDGETAASKIEGSSDSDNEAEAQPESDLQPESQPVATGDGVHGECELCSVKFTSKDHSEAHYRGAKHAKRAKLAKTKEEGLPEGIDSKSWGVAYNCSVCKVTLNSPEQLDQHMKEKHLERLTYCKVCEIQFDTLDEKDKHDNTKEHIVKDKEYRASCYCNVCNYQCRTPFHYEHHVTTKMHHSMEEVGNILCDYCQMKFACLYDFQEHNKDPAHIEKKREILTCAKCEITVKDMAQLEMHLQSKQHLKYVTRCEYCDVEYVTTREYMAHCKSSEAHNEKFREACYCTECEVYVNSPDQLKIHYTSKAHNKPATRNVDGFCGICDLDITSYQHMEIHLKGKQHRLKADKMKQEGFSEVGAGPSLWNEIKGRQLGWLYCQTCDISVRTGKILKEHVQGMSHKQNVEAKNASPALNRVLTCK